MSLNSGTINGSTIGSSRSRSITQIWSNLLMASPIVTAGAGGGSVSAGPATVPKQNVLNLFYRYPNDEEPQDINIKETADPSISVTIGSDTGQTEILMKDFDKDVIIFALNIRNSEIEDDIEFEVKNLVGQILG